MNNNFTPADLRLDGHIHIIGDGSSGSGCWLKLSKTYHKLLARIILSSLDLPHSALRGGLDQLYAAQLVRMVRESSIDAALILAHENVYDDNGGVIKDAGSFYTPNDYVLSLAKQHPDCFIPAVSIHPARADALDELDRCIELGAAMLKLLPNCQNVNCSDRRFTKFWQRLAAAGIPFLAHSGGELSVPVVNASYADPQILALPLECGVNVIAAHCGSRALIFDPNYLPKFLNMIEKYSNLYGDNSGMSTPLRAGHFKHLLSDSTQQRIIHGSDIPIPISAFWSLLRGRVSYAAWRDSRAVSNLVERDALIKRALGFKQQTFSRLVSLLPARIVENLQRSKVRHAASAGAALM